jgi:CTP synthase (UTP-ammonia lyase)
MHIPPLFGSRLRMGGEMMKRRVTLALIGEYLPSFLPHLKTAEALDHAASKLKIELDLSWISTAELVDHAADKLARFDAIWIAPGSPYKSMQGALNAIRWARDGEIACLGTCGGCQHMVIEYARNVLAFRDAEHAEYDPYASSLFITPLSCSLVGRAMDVIIAPGSRVAEIYGKTQVQEQYYCIRRSSMMVAFALLATMPMVRHVFC